MDRRTVTALIAVVVGCALAFVVVFAIFPAGPTPQDRPEVITAPQTQQLSPEQRYLDAVWPHLSPDREHDAEAVLDAGINGVCGVWSDPAASRANSINLLMETSFYSLTEATAIHEAAVEFLCPTT